jgi:S-DNA-T family DNA segregation ATPase FtsK/SpoIIIE
VREINQGPAVTQFSLEPGYMATKDAKGNPRKVRVSRIVNLSNDLALALSAAPIRIEAPIPGRPYVGLEVPNSSTNLVTLRNLMESDRFSRAHGPLKFTLGQDVSGHAVVVDLTSMPHLLIAGATGSGKSVCINALVACLLTTHTPETLRLLMIDPKMVELVNYNGIPHLLAPVVTELEKVVGVLSWAVREMDRRYKAFAKEEVRNIVGYNEKMTKQGKEILPYIVIIIDELADLMMMAPDEVERTVTRIAQMARATGMHLIIATQRPSVDVVTGLIKANFPARIAFAVTSQIDSRVILDTPGAERLLGKGDMLYMAPDSAKLRRLLGVFVSDQELNRLTQFWRGSLPPPERKPRALEDPKDLVQQPLWKEYKDIEKAVAESKQDELLEKAIAVVRGQGRASVSLLQRRLRIGYARAARLIDEMEDQGIIGPDEGGGRARSVLVTQADDDADPTADEQAE